MDNNKLFKIISFALIGLSALVSVYFFLTDFNDPEALATATGIFITLAYVFVGIGVISVVGFSILTMISNPSNAKNALIGVVALLLVFAAGYFLSSNEVYINDNTGEMYADAATSKMSEAGLIAFYILAAVAIGSIVYTEVSKSFK